MFEESIIPGKRLTGMIGWPLAFVLAMLLGTPSDSMGTGKTSTGEMAGTTDEVVIDLTTGVYTENNFRDKLGRHTAFAVDKKQINNLYFDAPQFLTLHLQTPYGAVPLKLKESSILTSDFRVELSSSGAENIDAKPVFYRGAIEGRPGSNAAITIMKNEITGMVIGSENGTFYLASYNSNKDHLIYYDQDILHREPWVCGTDESMVAPHSLLQGQVNTASSRQSAGCVNLHLECGYDLYQSLGSDEQYATEYILAMFNAVSLFYYTEGVSVAVSYLHIWDTQSPFSTANSAEAIDDFTTYFFSSGATVNGDLAHLLSSAGYGGRAYLTGLCSSVPFGVSSVPTSYLGYPSFNGLKTVCHELGHNFGSRHTHACVWNGNNTQIDDCGNIVAGSPDGLGICFFNGDEPIIPEGGGTVMSYCSIDWEKGLGDQPGDLIRNYVSAAFQSGCISDCNTPCHQIQLTEPVCSITNVGESTQFLSDALGCDSTVTTTFIYAPINVTNLSVPVCAMEDVRIDTAVFAFPGRCDSIVITDNYYSPEPTVVVNIPVCSEDEVSTESLLLTSSEGCDSLVVLNHNFEAVSTSISYQRINDGRFHFISELDGNVTSNFWTFGDGNSSTDANPYHEYLHPGEYLVENIVSHQQTCFDTFTLEVNVLVTHTFNDISIGDITVYPNPNHGVFKLELNTSMTLSDVQIEIVDIRGRLIFKEYFVELPGAILPFELPNIHAGPYFLTLNANEGTVTFKVLKM